MQFSNKKAVLREINGTDVGDVRVASNALLPDENVRAGAAPPCGRSSPSSTG